MSCCLSAGKRVMGEGDLGSTGYDIGATQVSHLRACDTGE